MSVGKNLLSHCSTSSLYRESWESVTGTATYRVLQALQIPHCSVKDGGSFQNAVESWAKVKGMFIYNYPHSEELEKIAITGEGNYSLKNF